MDLAGKNVVYLGGFGGIGQKTCAELLERQLQVNFLTKIQPTTSS